MDVLTVTHLVQSAMKALVPVDLAMWNSNPTFQWDQAQRVIRPGATRPAYSSIEYPGDRSVKDLASWFNLMEVVEKELDLKGELVIYEDEISIEFRREVPYTEAEIEDAKAYLEANPERPMPQVIQWRRKTVPLKTQTL